MPPGQTGRLFRRKRAMNHRQTIVMFAAHPDDAACGFSGTAIRLSRDYNIEIVCVTRGERGTPKPLAENAAIRTAEEEKADRLMNAHVTFLGEIDGEVFAGREVCFRAAAMLEAFAPIRAVFTHWPLDAHPDHTATAEIALKACHLAKITSEIYYCEEDVGEQTRNFLPDFYVDITPLAERKTEIIRCHACQNENDILATRTMLQNKFRGYEYECGYAEGFKAARPLSGTFRPLLLEVPPLP